MARLEKTQLDEKQYVAYEMIACTFLLGLVNDGHDKNTKSGAYLQQIMEITSTADANDTIKKLKARGGRDQLLMFLTGPAGSGKSTAMKVAQQFCYEFCTAVGIMRSDKNSFLLHTQDWQNHCLAVLQSPRLRFSINKNSSV